MLSLKLLENHLRWKASTPLLRKYQEHYHQIKIQIATLQISMGQEKKVILRFTEGAAKIGYKQTNSLLSNDYVRA